MKLSIIKLGAVALSLMLISCSKSDKSGGDGVGNGGDGVSMEFRTHAAKALDVAEINDQEIYNLDYPKLRTLLSDATIETTSESLRANSVEKDALNFPSKKKIVINRQRFSSYKKDEVKLVLALHEVLGLAGIADQQYEKSSVLIGFDPISMKAIMKKVDLLFVVDDSGSMQTHQQNLAKNIDYFLERFVGEKADFHIGVEPEKGLRI